VIWLYPKFRLHLIKVIICATSVFLAYSLVQGQPLPKYKFQAFPNPLGAGENRPNDGIFSAINSNGDVVGFAFAPRVNDFWSEHLIMYSGGVLRDLGTMPPRLHSRPVSINDSGQIAGFSYGGFLRTSFLYSNDAFLDLGGTDSEAFG
jgi:hypothetical protein